MINNILIYTGIIFVSWFIFMLIIFVSMEAIDFVIQKWSSYGK